MFPDETVATLCGLDDAACASGNDGAILVFNSSSGNWVAVDLSGNCTITVAGVIECGVSDVHATDCSSVSCTREGELCFQQSDNTLYCCESSSYVACGGGGGGGSITVQTDDAADISSVTTIDFTAPLAAAESPVGEANITCANATTSSVGCASFATANFAVSSGAVTIKTDGVTVTELANAAVDDNAMATDDFGDFSCGATNEDCLIDPNAVALATDTTGDYVSDLTAGAGLASTGATSGENISHSLSTASGEADFLASGALTCGASTQGKAQVHTTPLQYCDNAATPTLQYAAYGNSSGEATAAGNDSVALGTDTTGNYVATIADAGNANITVSGSGSESAAITLDVVDVTCTDCLNATEIEDIYLLTAGDTMSGQLVLHSTGVASGAADPADGGVVRLGNNEDVCWELATPGTDICITLGTDDEFDFDAGGEFTCDPTTARNCGIMAIENAGDVAALGVPAGSRALLPQADGWYDCDDAETCTLIGSGGGGTGDVTAVGDCTTGACFTTAAGGGTSTIMYFDGATSDTIKVALTSADPTGSTKTITLPAATGTVELEGHTHTEGDIDGFGDYLQAAGDTATGQLVMETLTPLSFDGTNLGDGFVQVITVAEPTAARAATIPDATGEFSLLGQTIGISEMVAADILGSGTDLLSTSQPAPASNLCLEMNSSGLVVQAADTCANLGGTPISFDTVSGTGDESADMSHIECGTNAGLACAMNTADELTVELASTVSLLGQTIGSAELVAEDFGDFNCGGVGNDCLIDPNAVALETDTVGDYVQNITAGAGLASTGATSGENIAHSLSTASTEADFLTDGGNTNLTCGASTQGKAQVNNGGGLDICTGEGTPALASLFPIIVQNGNTGTNAIRTLDFDSLLSVSTAGTGACSANVCTGESEGLACATNADCLDTEAEITLAAAVMTTSTPVQTSQLPSTGREQVFTFHDDTVGLAITKYSPLNGSYSALTSDDPLTNITWAKTTIYNPMTCTAIAIRGTTIGTSVAGTVVAELCENGTCSGTDLIVTGTFAGSVGQEAATNSATGSVVLTAGETTSLKLSVGTNPGSMSLDISVICHFTS